MKNKYINLIILLFVGFVVYANSLRSPFMLDDYGFFNQFQGSSILSHFSPDPQRAYYRPLAHVVPHLNYLVFKMNPVCYHMVNVLLLSLAAWSVVLLLSMVMAGRLALAAGILFLVHPINSIMVNYITASVFAVQIMCMCLALYCMTLSFPRVLIGNLFFILALLCHETSFMIPFYGVLLCLMREMNLKKALNITKWLWLTLVLYMLFRAFNAPLSKSLFHSIAINGLSLGESLASVLQLLSWYIQKLFYPVGIFLMWSKPFVHQASVYWLTIGLVCCVALGVGLCYLWRVKQQAVLLFILWFLIGLLPVFLGAFATPYMGALLEPHWFIPATVGLFAASVLLVSHLVQKFLWQHIIFAVVFGILV